MNRIISIFQVKEIRNKILIVLGLLVAYRVLAAIPIPDPRANRTRQRSVLAGNATRELNGQLQPAA